MSEQPKFSWLELQQRVVSKAMADETFRDELLRDPRAVVQREAGMKVPEHLRLQVLEAPANTLYLVLPAAQSQTNELSDEELEGVSAGGNWYGLNWSPGLGEVI